MEEEKIVKETLKKVELSKDEIYQKIVQEEKDLVERATSTSSTLEESLPPMNMDDGFGNIMPHILINGEYIPKPLADVKIQERRVVVEYQELEKIKADAEAYLKVRKEAKKLANN